MRKKAYRYSKDDYIFVYQMLVLRSEGLSYPRIGKMFNKDHSTIIHWCRKFNVDIGKEVPKPEFFNIKVYRTPVVVGHKYEHIINERINPGKKSYAEYLKERDARSHMRPLPQ